MLMEKMESFPPGVKVGPGTIITGPSPFRRFQSTHLDVLVIGRDCTLDHCQFSIGKSGRISIGDNCYLTSVILMCEKQIRIGSRVMIGWNSALADSDFHPIDPALRIQD